jgi:hypothetical protein
MKNPLKRVHAAAWSAVLTHLPVITVDFNQQRQVQTTAPLLKMLHVHMNHAIHTIQNVAILRGWKVDVFLIY